MRRGERASHFLEVPADPALIRGLGAAVYCTVHILCSWANDCLSSPKEDPSSGGIFAEVFYSLGLSDKQSWFMMHGHGGHIRPSLCAIQ